MLRSLSGRQPNSGRQTVQSTVAQQIRHWYNPYLGYQRGTGKTFYPGRGQPADTEELRRRQFWTKSRDQWDYKRINEYVTRQSEFTKMDNRPDFDGPREAKYEDVEANMHTNPPNTKRLWEYFDEYTKPGVNQKYAAAVAVKEQWDAENFYYPGESWQTNRPGFRSVPKEMLNKQSIYYWKDAVRQQEMLWAASRPRTWNPIWPPPGYKVPKLACTREFVFGVEEPGLVHEIERYYWARMWFEGNTRHGLSEYILFFWLAYILYYSCRVNEAYYWRQRQMFANTWYPGRSLTRCYGEPTGSSDPDDIWWWQKPLEDRKTFPEQGVIWYLNESRFGYGTWRKRELERKKLEAAVS